MVPSVSHQVSNDKLINWGRFGVQLIAIVVAVILTYAAAAQRITIAEYRLSVMEQQLKSMTDTNKLTADSVISLREDMRELKTLVKNLDGKFAVPK